MNLLCMIGRHRWVSRQQRSETGQLASYQQCDRCGHYPTTSHWSQGQGHEPPGGERSSASAPSGY